MKYVLGYALMAATLLLSACNPTYIDHDYDLNADFSRYRTFAWYEQTTMTEGTPQAVQQSGLVEGRIKRAVNDGLAAKGLELVDTNADLTVVYHIGVQDVTEISSTGTGYGYGYGYRYGDNVRTDHFQEGKFILDFIDTNTEQLVWRGIAEGVMEENPTPELLDKNIKDMIGRLLAKYPPPPE